MPRLTACLTALAAAASLGAAPARSTPPTAPQRAIGERLVVGFPATRAPASLLRAIARGDVGGVILFSRRIATGELRARVGFRGVSISDDLETPAIERLGSPARRAIDAALAGDDLLLFAQDYRAGLAGERALLRRAASGGLPGADLDAAAARVERLRTRLAAPPGG